MLDDGFAFRGLWSGTDIQVDIHDILEVGGSDTTRRPHSESVVQPRPSEFFELDEAPRPIQLSRPLDYDLPLSSRLELAEAFHSVPRGRDDPGPVSSSSALSSSQLDIYYPYQNPYRSISRGRQTLIKPGESEVGSGRFPSLGARNFQELAMTCEPEPSPTPLIPATDHITQPETDLTQLINSLRGASNAHSKLPQAQPRRPANDGGRQTLLRPGRSELWTGLSPALGARNFQELAMTCEPEPSLTPSIPAMDHIDQPETDLSQLIDSLRGAPNTHSKLPQAQPRRPANNELCKGVPLHDLPASYPLYIVEFKAGRTDLFYATDLTLDIHVGDLVLVEADRGRDLGKVVNDTVTKAEVDKFQRERQSSYVGHSETSVSKEKQSTSAGDAGPKKEINPKLIHGKAGTQDAQYSLTSPFFHGSQELIRHCRLLVAKTQDEVKALRICQAKVRQKRLPLEVIDAEYQW